MQNIIFKSHSENYGKICILLCLCTLLGIFPIITAKIIAKLIDNKTDYLYMLYSCLLILQTIIFRLKEFLLQQIQAKTFPKIQANLKRTFITHNLSIQDNINKIARFASNLWPLCQILRSLTLLLSTTFVIYKDNNNIISWLIFMTIATGITVGWQPNTKNIIQRKQILSNKLAASIGSNNKRITSACIKANTIANLIIYKQQAIKTVIISCLIVIIAYQNWQSYLINSESFGKTLMLLNISISQTEILWWLQHELSFLRTELQSFFNNSENLINKYSTINQA